MVQIDNAHIKGGILQTDGTGIFRTVSDGTLEDVVNQGTVEIVTGDDTHLKGTITNEGVIFFFNQGGLLPEAAGATQVLVPRSVIDPLLA